MTPYCDELLGLIHIPVQPPVLFQLELDVTRGFLQPNWPRPCIRSHIWQHCSNHRESALLAKRIQVAMLQENEIIQGGRCHLGGRNKANYEKYLKIGYRFLRNMTSIERDFDILNIPKEASGWHN